MPRDFNNSHPIHPARGDLEGCPEFTPTHLPPIEAADASRSRFIAVLKSADIPSLVQYLVKAGAKVDELEALPAPFREYLASADFKRQPSNWINPTIYALADRTVIELSLNELISRLEYRESER